MNKSTNEIEYVYKPHDLSADNAVVGTDGMLAKINNFFRDKNLLVGTPLEGKDAFATVHIDLENHLEDFVVKKSKMIKQEAEEYYYKAGMLQVITDAMAVTDLHQDNIMPTEDGPLIIDAEVDFFRANFSGLLSGLTWVDSEEYPRTACFLIDEGNDNVVHSGKAFQNSQSSYRKQYIEGQKFMLKQINDNKAFFLKELDNQLKKVIKARILPMSTQYFSDLLQKSIGLRKTDYFIYVQNITPEMVGSSHNISDLASGIINKVIKKLADIEECYIFTENFGVYLNVSDFGNSIMETFENGTIVAMYIGMNGCIYLDDKKIGYLYDLGDKTDECVESSKKEFRTVTNITTDGKIYIYDKKKWNPHDLEESDEPKQLSREQIIEMIKDNFNIKLSIIKIKIKMEAK